MLDRIKMLLGSDWTRTDELIHSSLKSDIYLLDRTNASILESGGKQMRPLIALLVARACSPDRILNDDSIRFAAASELLHNATLLHDDVADSSAVRRGAPTVMSLLGGPASVLIGDFWLVRAMEDILASPELGNVVIRIFAKTLSDLAEGEMLQLQKASSGDTTEEDYYRIIYNKTASLFEATGVSAAISVDAPEVVVESIRKYCVNLGIAFQIKDDLLDYSDGEVLGKPVGVDLKEGKITLPLLGALKSVDKDEESRIRSLVMDICSHPENILAVREFVFSHGGIEYALDRLEESVSKSKVALDILPDSDEKDYLSEIAGFTARREK